MPRQARQKSVSGIYHVMLRGINRQQIFMEQEDYRKFLFVLNDYKKVCGFQLYAYCLMPNHIHLLIREGEESLGQVFKRVCGKFVYWYNLKYQRVGHLFQDRYRSEPINTDAYFLTALRYIHQNPKKAGLCRAIADYPYSSYGNYARNSLIDCDFTFGILEKWEFAKFNEAENDDVCMEDTVAVKQRVTNEEAERIFLEITKKPGMQLQIPGNRINTALIQALTQKGLSSRQISTLTGIARSTVQTV